MAYNQSNCFFSKNCCIISRNCCEYINVTDVIEYVHRSTLKMTNLNTAHQEKIDLDYYYIVQDDFASTVTIKWKPGFTFLVILD